MKRKLIVGLGCSWCQGEGGYTEDIFDQYNGRVNLPMHEGMHLLPMEIENSWVNVLCKEYFTNHEPINLGQRGIGNRAAAKTLYLTNIDWDQTEDSIVIFLLSGFERFDFFNQDIYRYSGPEKELGFKLPFKILNHYNFNTMWPNTSNSLWKEYLDKAYSEEQSAMETYANIMEVQTFCKAHNLKFILCNAFGGDLNYFMNQIPPDFKKNIDWEKYLHNYVDYPSFLHLFVKLDDLPELETVGWHDLYHSRKRPAKYMTNCIHPTIEGYKVMAKEMANFIKNIK